MYWLEKIHNLPQPLKTWLIKSYLSEPVNNSSLLIVDPEHYALINNTYYLSKIYPIAKQVYPEIISLHISCLPISESLRTKVISFESLLTEN